ncbi:ribonuclease H-like domain-containing protein [Tanacetum coccineum]
MTSLVADLRNIPNDDERVANDLNKGKSDSSSSFVSGSNINTANFPVDSGNDDDSTDDLVATQNEEIDDMNKEMDALLRNGTWETVQLPEDRKAIGSKWIYKIMFRSSGEIVRYKARLVAQDVNTAFLYGDLEEVFYMKPPEGYFPSDNKFTHSSLKSHLKIAFQILRNLKGCPSLGIHIVKESGMSLTAFSDADWAKFVVTRKSVTANPVFHERTKHLEIDLHFVSEKILKGVVETVKVDSANQIANILTKGLDTFQHKDLGQTVTFLDSQFKETLGSRLYFFKDGWLIASSGISSKSVVKAIKAGLLAYC